MKVPWILAGIGIGLAAYLIANPPATPATATGLGDVEDAAAKTFGWGNKQRVKGTGGDLVGRVKEGVGNLTGNDQLAGEGVADQAVGSVKDAAGKVAQAAGETLHDLNR